MNQINNKKPTKAEWAIVEDIRKVEFGRVVVFIQNGKPFRKEVVEQARLNEDGSSNNKRPTKKPRGIEL